MSLDEDHYIYLGTLHAENTMHNEVKIKIRNKYIRRVKSKLSGGIPIIRYTAGILDCTKAPLDALDRKTRKRMIMNHALHVRSDVNRLYLSRNMGVREVLQVV